MRHQRRKYNIGKNSAHKKSLLRNLAVEVIDHESIKTTITKARAVKPFVEKLITLAKVDSVANRRLAFSKLNNQDAVKKLFILAPRYQTRPGGYTRIVKSPIGRVGDNAEVGILSLV